MAEDHDLPIIQEVPIVTMQLLEINGYTKTEAEADTTIKYPKWSYNREYRVTYRNTLIDSETIIEGDWEETVNSKDTVFISMDQGYAENMHVELGDEIYI